MQSVLNAFNFRINVGSHSQFCPCVVLEYAISMAYKTMYGINSTMYFSGAECIQNNTAHAILDTLKLLLFVCV